MKVLVVLSAVVAACLAKPGLLGAGIVAAPAVVPAADAIPAALNGLTADGVPVDTPAVQVARAAHLTSAALAQSRILAAPAILAAPGLVAAPALAAAGIVDVRGLIAAPVAAVAAADAIPAALNGLTPLGTPIDTPAVQAARAVDAAAHLNAKALTLG